VNMSIVTAGTEIFMKTPATVERPAQIIHRYSLAAMRPG
jgi:hypothetical protein